MRLSRNAFDRLVENAIDSLPPELAAWIDEVPIIVEDVPAAGDPDTLGLYHGRALTERSVEEPMPLPSQIFLYRLPLMDACATRAQLAAEIRKTLYHELGHHAGLNENDLDRLGYGALDDGPDFELDE